MHLSKWYVEIEQMYGWVDGLEETLWRGEIRVG